MSVFVYSVSLFITGSIIGLVFYGQVGVGLMILATIGMVYSLVRYVESEATRIDQRDIDQQIEDMRPPP
jgi:hypothetical protein